MISACSMRDSASELFIQNPLEVVGAIKLLVAMLADMLVAMLVEQWLLVKLEMVINSVTPDSRLAILLIPLFPGNVENQLQDNVNVDVSVFADGDVFTDIDVDVLVDRTDL